MDEFNFAVGDVVLAEWEDKLFYAKIQKIEKSKSYCHLIFDDNSVEECPFSKIHSGSSLVISYSIRFPLTKPGNTIAQNPVCLKDRSVYGP